MHSSSNLPCYPPFYPKINVIMLSIGGQGASCCWLTSPVSWVVKVTAGGKLQISNRWHYECSKFQFYLWTHPQNWAPNLVVLEESFPTKIIFGLAKIYGVENCLAQDISDNRSMSSKYGLSGYVPWLVMFLATVTWSLEGLFLASFGLFLGRCPAQARGVDGDRRSFVLRTVHQVVNDLWRYADDLLTLPVADQIQGL